MVTLSKSITSARKMLRESSIYRTLNFPPLKWSLSSFLLSTWSPQKSSKQDILARFILHSSALMVTLKSPKQGMLAKLTLHYSVSFFPPLKCSLFFLRSFSRPVNEFAINYVKCDLIRWQRQFRARQGPVKFMTHRC